MKILTLLILLFMTGAVSAQIGIMAGGSTIKAFGQPKPYGGFHLGVEVPRDDAVSIYGRFTHQFKQNSEDSSFISLQAYDPVNTFPSVINIKGLSSFNYTVIEGGTRYYLGNGYDFGWAAYGGTNLSLIFNSVKMKYEEYDEVAYELMNDYGRKATIISFGVGLSGGVKYTMTPVGTFYFDAGLSYLLYALPSNNMAASEGGPRFSQLLFNFNLGFRKDLLW